MRARTRRKVRGRVTAAGVIAAGTGFLVQKGATGIYVIRLAPAFVTEPVITGVTAGPATGRIFGITSKTRDTINIQIENHTGTTEDIAFEFTAEEVA